MTSVMPIYPNEIMGFSLCAMFVLLQFNFVNSLRIPHLVEMWDTLRSLLALNLGPKPSQRRLRAGLPG